jgi:hypothetical protein
MTIPYNINDYIKGVNGFGNNFCDIKYSAKLAAATEQTIAVPGTSPMGSMTPGGANGFIAVITSDTAGVFVCKNATAALPVGGTFASTTSSLLPTGQPYARIVSYGDVLHFIATNANSNISIEFYAQSY